MNSKPLILGALAVAAVGGLWLWSRRSSAAALGELRNDAAGPRLPAMPQMPTMPTMPGMPTMPTMGHAPNAPQLSPGFGSGPQAAAGLFKGMWG